MNAESVSFFCVYEEENYVIKYFADSYFRDVYGMDMPENQIAEFAWHADYRYCSGTICA